MDLQSHLRSLLPDYLNALERMVAVNSFTANAAGVDAVGEVAAGLFASLGFTPEFVPAACPAFGRHLFLHRGGASGPAHRFRVAPGHCVRAAGGNRRGLPLPTRRRSGHRSGRGRHQGRHDRRLHGARRAADRASARIRRLCLAGRAGRLRGTAAPDFARGCRYRLPAEQTAAILVMECGMDGKPDHTPLVVCRKGMVNFQVVVAGKASHSGTGFWRGRNAILEASRLALAMAEVSDRDRHLTVNVGVVQGGTVTNRVPHECVLSGEMRAFAPEVLADGMARLRTIVESGTARIEFTDELSPWPENAGSRALLEVWRKAGTGLGTPVEPEWRGGLSDGNLLWMHAPTIDGLGPIGGNCHCSQKGPDGRGQEYALEASFVSKALLTAAALVELAGEASG